MLPLFRIADLNKVDVNYEEHQNWEHVVVVMGGRGKLGNLPVEII